MALSTAEKDTHPLATLTLTDFETRPPALRRYRLVAVGATRTVAFPFDTATLRTLTQAPAFLTWSRTVPVAFLPAARHAILSFASLPRRIFAGPVSVRDDDGAAWAGATGPATAPTPTRATASTAASTAGRTVGSTEVRARASTAVCAQARAVAPRRALGQAGKVTETTVSTDHPARPLPRPQPAPRRTPHHVAASPAPGGTLVGGRSTARVQARG